jgi:hypothetical protein
MWAGGEVSTLGRELKLYPKHRGRKPGRPAGVKSTLPIEEYFQDRQQINKWTYWQAVESYAGTGIPKLCFAQLVDVFEHKRLCKPGVYNKITRKPPGKRGCSACAENNEWVLSDQVGYVFAFIECCNRVGVDPAYMRKRFTEMPSRLERERLQQVSLQEAA